MNVNANKTGAPGEANPEPCPALRLPPEKRTPREQMTLGQQQEASQADQAVIALETEVREAARKFELDASVTAQVAQASRAGFRIVNGEPVPVEADRQTVLLAADGVNVLSVKEWVRRQAQSLGHGPRAANGQWQAEGVEEALPQRNPFRRKTWNLTEQMRLARRDPKLARRLKAEAIAHGD